MDSVPEAPKAPVWRSSPKTPTKRRRLLSDKASPRRRHTSSRRQSTSITTPSSSPTTVASSSRSAAISAHKNVISKHRQQWAAPETPPAYWDIGFPNTQEVTTIQDEASKMHRKKRNDIEVEARYVVDCLFSATLLTHEHSSHGGKYRRRQV